MTSEIAPHIWVPEPQLAFHPDRPSDSAIHPLRGLIQHGPHSSGIIPTPIRAATIVPSGEGDRLYSFVKQLDATYHPNERRDYLPDWPGFQQIFGLRVRPAEVNCHIELASHLEADLNSAPRPHIVLAEHIVRAIHRHQTQRALFDILLIYLPKRWAAGFTGGLEEDFDLHDYLKATTAAIGMPIQLVREDSAISYGCQASVMWRIGLALYVKAGGIPWTLSETDPETAHIGISYAMRLQQSDTPRFITCCSQIFNADGSGLEFVTYDAHEFEVYRDNPFLSRAEMFRVITRSMDLYRRRHAGKSPRRVVVHKTTEFKPDEVDGCMEALHLCESVDLVQVIQNVGWRGVRIDQGQRGRTKGTAALFPVLRGTAIGITPREVLLWTHGNVDNVSTRGSYFKGSKGTPSPIRLVRHAGHGSWDDTVRDVLGLTKMNWNNDSLYDMLPVTISYAQVLARVIKRMPNLRRAPYQFRFFM